MAKIRDIREAPPAADVSGLTEHLFRHESGRLVSVLAGIFGSGRLQLAEDVVQEALVKALQTWPYYGIPDNPAAWITQTAKNLALDVIRRETNFHSKEADVAMYLEQTSAGKTNHKWSLLESEVRDDSLRLFFACCHPEIPQEAQAALALKTLCGFGVSEIAKAFLTSEAAIAKRLTRAKQRIRELDIKFEIPAGQELCPRLAGVLQTIYLLFNEGYKASSGEHLLKEELCHEAIRLALLLVSHPAGDKPQTHALLALMLLNTGRMPARMDPDGQILRLKDQDRHLWNHALISRGMYHISKSAAGKDLSAYHLQAAIAACHSTAPTYEETDWRQILWLYDRLLDVDNSPVVALNRAVAVSKVFGAARGIEAVRAIRNQEPLQTYYLFHAILAEFEMDLGNPAAAIAHWEKAILLTAIRSEQEFLTSRMHECEQSIERANS